MGSTVFNEDCMTGMARYPDKFFDIAIVDPPYGIRISSNPVRQKHAKKDWDSSIPNIDYFSELFRVSKEQIIWGGNYFGLPPSQGYTIWDKLQPANFSLAMCEFAWQSIQSPAKIFRLSVLKERDKIHPTQKPIALYDWLIVNYAKDCKNILDTHVGSGSSRISAHKHGKDFVGFEIDKGYWEAQESRFARFIAQGVLFC